MKLRYSISAAYSHIHFSGDNDDNPAVWVQSIGYGEQARAKCLKDYTLLIQKEIDTLEALEFETFRSVSNRKAIKELKKVLQC